MTSNTDRVLAEWLEWQYHPGETILDEYGEVITEMPAQYHDKQGEPLECPSIGCPLYEEVWNPTQDLNQVHKYLLPKIAEMDMRCAFAFRLAKIVHEQHPLTKGNKESIYPERVISLDSMWLYWCISATPAQLCEAIIQAAELEVKHD